MRIILSILLLSVCYMQDCPEGYEWIHEIPSNNYGDEPISTYDCFYQNDINKHQ